MKTALKLLTATAFLATLATAQTPHYYKLDNVQTQHYLELSKEELKNNNLSLARLYAQKAVQANAWNKAAWQNYDNILHKLIKSGEYDKFGSKTNMLPHNKAAAIPSPSEGSSQYEGC
jgi:hypothetical protein